MVKTNCSFLDAIYPTLLGRKDNVTRFFANISDSPNKDDLVAYVEMFLFLVNVAE